MDQMIETGIGRALRGARERRGKTLDDACRETRIRFDYLLALEKERFGELREDVYIRGFLRSYAGYLGLNQDKVISVYERAYGRASPPPAPVERAPTVAPTEAVVLTEKKRPNWLLAAGAAVIVLAAAAAIGILNRSSAVPEPAPVSEPPAVPLQSPVVQVGVTALRDAQMSVALDGRDGQRIQLDEGEARSFEAEQSIRLSLADGGTVELVVNGRRAGLAGQLHQPYDETFTPASFQESPSPPGPGA